jgi:pyruvate dehydrogenase E2 component (dihydrolipoamide acetyltransferase)
MAVPVLLPKQGQSVETCLLMEWKKKKGEAVNQGDILCSVETDKAVFDVEAPETGTLIDTFFEEGEDVPVLTNIAAIGNPGESADEFRPSGSAPAPEVEVSAPVKQEPQPQVQATAISPQSHVGVSPRARKLAQEKGIQLEAYAIPGTGPGGRVIERDIISITRGQAPLTPLAKAASLQSGLQAPAQGTGIGGRVLASDLGTISPAHPEQVKSTMSKGEITKVQIKGIRKLIADRMLHSMQTTAQLTLNSTADARQLLAMRKRFKASDELLGLQKVTINDLVLFATAKILAQHTALNALLEGDVMSKYSDVHLAFAVDTPRGLMVPVIRGANHITLKSISAQAKELGGACQSGSIAPEALNGGTFTVTNLGGLGVETFTPILNPPQVGILGVGNIGLKPIQQGANVEFIPHLNLSLTINHQVVDGAPAARFLNALAAALANMEVTLAL